MVLCNGICNSAPFSNASPWPLPASITTTPDAQAVAVMLFHFNVTGHTCDILEAALVRYYGIMFSGQPIDRENSRVDVSRIYGDNGPQLLFEQEASNDIHLKSLDVAVMNECEKWPSLEMDESCELLNIYMYYFIRNTFSNIQTLRTEKHAHWKMLT